MNSSAVGQTQYVLASNTIDRKNDLKRIHKKRKKAETFFLRATLAYL